MAITPNVIRFDPVNGSPLPSSPDVFPVSGVLPVGVPGCVLGPPEGPGPTVGLGVPGLVGEWVGVGHPFEPGEHEGLGVGCTVGVPEGEGLGVSFPW